MAVTNYFTVDGQMYGEETGGNFLGYVPDALGSVMATTNSGGTSAQNTYRYKPYGEILAKTGAATDPKFLWTGNRGSRKSPTANADQYNRLRHYVALRGIWLTVDSLWPHLLDAYVYVSPTTRIDPSGRAPCVPDCCESMSWPPAEGCSEWVDCPEPTSMWSKCDEYLKTRPSCADLILYVRARARQCIGACPNGTGTGGGVPDAATRCCKDTDWRGCTKCCASSGLGSSSGAKACDTYCLLAHEAGHWVQCRELMGNGGRPLPECCPYYSGMMCLFFITAKYCWDDPKPDPGRIYPEVPECIKKAREAKCAGA